METKRSAQLWDQVKAAAVAPVYAFVMTYAILRVFERLMPLRVAPREESLGLDVVEHGEEAYASGEGAILVMPDSGLQPPVPVGQP